MNINNKGSSRFLKGTFYVPGTEEDFVCFNVLCRQGYRECRYFFSHFTNEETEVQRG